MPRILPFTDEQARVLVNVEQHYDTWIRAERALQAMPYGMAWKTVSGKDYLYELRDRTGNGRSLGRRGPENEAIHLDYHERKAALRETSRLTGDRLAETCALYRALRLPLVASESAKILREADRQGILEVNLLVVGTNALPAYSIEAGGRILDLSDETDDFDMSWKGTADDGKNPVWDVLKAVDATYTVNSEKTFQARNAKAHEFELLVAPSQEAGLGRTDRPRPVMLPEQEWLLEGRPISQVVVARDGSPARIVAPDPRWFALQKLWLSEKSERSALKKPKDLKQGRKILDVVAEHMPHLPLDDAFESSLPEELSGHYQAWKDNRSVVSLPRGW